MTMSWQPLRRINIRESWRRARAQFAAVVAERDVLKQELEMFERENEMLRAQLAEVQASNRELRAANWARWEAWAEVARLHRERQIDLARKAERQPDMLLH
jgi:hypothetical protein